MSTVQNTTPQSSTFELLDFTERFRNFCLRIPDPPSLRHILVICLLFAVEGGSRAESGSLETRWERDLAESHESYPLVTADQSFGEVTPRPSPHVQFPSGGASMDSEEVSCGGHLLMSAKLFAVNSRSYRCLLDARLVLEL
ncbi:hypothetical protein R1sor_025812 [Riccia sorocarpa]|uniref:Uncharacterized protein n=1 Tax=Riccia sorocarpa TaxID=122646 RepID=A0ABD3GDL0_9MARC